MLFRVFKEMSKIDLKIEKYEKPTLVDLFTQFFCRLLVLFLAPESRAKNLFKHCLLDRLIDLVSLPIKIISPIFESIIPS